MLVYQRVNLHFPKKKPNFCKVHLGTILDRKDRVDWPRLLGALYELSLNKSHSVVTWPRCHGEVMAVGGLEHGNFIADSW